MITLYTAATPNGRKISVALEVLGLEYQVHPIALSDNEQKQPWYLAINPNGKIPAIIDHDRGDLAVFESGAILTYLAEKTGKLLSSEVDKRYAVLQWLNFQVGGVGPMQGQANVFYRYWDNRYPEVTQRYQDESHRLYGVLEQQLQHGDFVTGEFSIADIALYPWIRLADWAAIDLATYPNIRDWLERTAAIDGIERGMQVPEELSDSGLLALGKAIAQ